MDGYRGVGRSKVVIIRYIRELQFWNSLWFVTTFTLITIIVFIQQWNSFLFLQQEVLLLR